MNGLFLLAALYLMTLGMGIVLGLIFVICETSGLPGRFIMTGLLSLLLWASWKCR